MSNLNFEWFQLSFDVYIVYVDKKSWNFKIFSLQSWKFSESNWTLLALWYGKIMKHRVVFKDSVGVSRSQPSFETIFGCLGWQIRTQRLKIPIGRNPPPSPGLNRVKNNKWKIMNRDFAIAHFQRKIKLISCNNEIHLEVICI